MTISKKDLFYCLILLAFSLAVWLPSRFFPLFWDSTYVVKTATQIMESGFTQLVSQEQGYAHPTLFPALLALIWQFFGQDPQISHSLTLPFLPILLISTYFLIKRHTNTEYGLVGAIFVGFTPVVLAEYVNVYTDLPMAALVTLSLVLWSSHHYKAWVLVFAAAILTKIPAIAVMPYFLLDAAFTKNRRQLLYAFFAPLITVAIWLIYHKHTTGWWLIKTLSGHTLALNRGLSAVISDWFQIILTIFMGQGRGVITFLAIIALIILHYKPKITLSSQLVKYSKEVVAILSAAFLFAATGEFGFRYAIFIYPLYYLMVVSIAHQLTPHIPKAPLLLGTSALAIALYFTSLWRPIEKPYTSSVFLPPDSLEIIDYLQVFRWLASYAVLNRNEAVEYYGGFPDNISLTEPKMGFVDQPIPYQDCKDFKYHEDKVQIIVFHPFSPTNYACFQLITAEKLQAFTGIEVNGKWIDLYYASPSAAVSP